MPHALSDVSMRHSALGHAQRGTRHAPCANRHAPNQGCADSTTASLGITMRCVNWGSFHHGIEYIGPKHSTEKLCECNILSMAVTKVYSTFA